MKEAVTVPQATVTAHKRNGNSPNFKLFFTISVITTAEDSVRGSFRKVVSTRSQTSFRANITLLPFTGACNRHTSQDQIPARVAIWKRQHPHLPLLAHIPTSSTK
jgi:hypothetical protein